MNLLTNHRLLLCMYVHFRHRHSHRPLGPHQHPQNPQPRDRRLQWRYESHPVHTKNIFCSICSGRRPLKRCNGVTSCLNRYFDPTKLDLMLHFAYLEVACSGESNKIIIHIDRNLRVCAGSHQWKQCTHGVSFSLVQWIGNYNPWNIRLHRWRKKCKPTIPEISLNFRRLYLHNHLEFEAPVKIWLVNAATFSAME